MPTDKLKILYIIPSLRKGGAERIVLDICREISRRDDAQAVILTFREGNEYPDLSEGLDIRHFNADIRLSLWKRDRVNTGIFMQLVNDYGPDVIHSHLYEAEIVSRESIVPGVKYFSHFHDAMPVFGKHTYMEYLTRRGIARWYEKYRILRRYEKCSNSFICISQLTLQYARESLGDEFRYFLLPNAIDFRKFNRKIRQKPFEGKTIRLLNIGSMVPNKNQVFLLGVLEQLIKGGYEATLTILGDGPDREMLENETATRGIKHAVRFEGIVHHVEDHFSDADVYVHAANKEAFGLVLLEAMAGGLPVVSLDGGGNRDIVQDGVNGYLLKQQDAADFARKIIAITSDQAHYETLSKQAVSFAKKFDIGPYVDNLLDIYRS